MDAPPPAYHEKPSGSDNAHKLTIENAMDPLLCIIIGVMSTDDICLYAPRLTHTDTI